MRFSFLLALLVLACAGCTISTLAKDAKTIAGEVVEGVQPKAAPLGAQLATGLATGARDVLTNEESQARFLKLEQALVQGIRDPLLSDATKKQLVDLELTLVQGVRDPLTSKETTEQLTRLEDNLFSNATTNLVSLRTKVLDEQQLRDELNAIMGDVDKGAGKIASDTVSQALGDATQARIAAIRDELLGKNGQVAAAAFVDAMSANLKTRINQDFLPQVHQEETRTAVIAIVLGVVFALLAIVVAYSRYKYRKLTQLLASRIDQMGARDGYEELTHAISVKAKDANLERFLRDLLVDFGINDRKGTTGGRHTEAAS